VRHRHESRAGRGYSGPRLLAAGVRPLPRPRPAGSSECRSARPG